MAEMMAIAGLGLGAASIGMGIAGSEAAKQEAEALRAIGKLEANERRRQSVQLKGAQRVAFLKGGVDISGTPLDVLAETAVTEELAALRIEHGAQLGAISKETQGKLMLAQSILQGTSMIGQTLLGGAGSFGGTTTAAPTRTQNPATVFADYNLA